MLNLFCNNDKRYFCANPNCKYHIIVNAKAKVIRDYVRPVNVDASELSVGDYKPQNLKTFKIRRHRYFDAPSETVYYFCEICRNASETLAQIKTH
jgi:hypothetical protein